MADKDTVMKWPFFLALSLLCLPLPAAAQTVFAAASLRGALEEISAHHDGNLRISYGGSGTMARQIASGAPADLVVLAHPVWMDWLAQRRDLMQRGDVATGTLVLIGPKGAELPRLKDLPDRLGTRRLAIGQRDAVPAGIYAAQFLEHMGLWEKLETQLAETDNVRAALALVAQGAAPFGITYASDAAADPRVDILYTADAKTHDPIRFPAAALTEAGKPLLALLESEKAAVIFEKYGFGTP